MRRKSLIAAAAGILLCACTGEIASAGAVFLGPGHGLTGNDTGGIMQYVPDFKTRDYREIAAYYCARWGRLSRVTSVHARYGDYVSFVCMDRPDMIH